MADTYVKIPASGPTGLTPVGAAGTLPLSDGTGVSWTNQIALGASGFLSVGTSPATTGDIRVPQAFALRNNDTANRDVIVTAAGTITVGNTGVGTTVTGASVTLNASAMNLAMSNGAAFNFFSSVDFGFGNSPGTGKKAVLITPAATGAASVYFGMETTSSTITRQTPDADTAAKAPQTLQILGQTPFASATVTRRKPGGVTIGVAAPVSGETVGDIVISGSLSAGYATQAMADANQTLSDTKSIANVIETTGANTGVRTLTINALPLAGAIRFLRNNCTGSGIAVKFATGAATGTIAAGASAVVISNGTDAFAWIVGT